MGWWLADRRGEEGPLAAEVWLETRPKGRPPRWAFRATVGGAVAFESSRVAIRFGVEADAAWLAGLVDALVARGESPGQPGRFAGIRWEGDLGDDCWAALGEMRAHAEHMQGPRRGGVVLLGRATGASAVPHGRLRGSAPQRRIGAMALRAGHALGTVGERRMMSSAGGFG